MTIKNILIAYNGTIGAEKALSLGCLVARKYGAHLTGLLTHGLPNAVYALGGHLPQTAMHDLEEADRVRRGEIRKSFHTATAHLDGEMTHFLDVYGEADQKLMEIARTYDLVIMGVSDSENEFQHMEVHPDQIARHSGRPVLVVPQTYETESLPDIALLAWDGRRAAARAMADAMHILESKSLVSVLTVGNPDDFERTTGPILAHLQRHGIPCQALIKDRKSGPIAECILDSVNEEGAGLLVMGAYEHSKLKEDLFGGVTNTVINKSKVPVLLSH